MKNKNIIYGILAVLTIAGLLFLTNKNDENVIEKTKKTKVLEVKNDKKTVKNVEFKKEVSKTVKVEDNPVVYKNDDSNKGYNMELDVPEKWSHLDYSHLGQPKEVALKPEEYLPGDKLYSKDHPDYLKEGKRYFSADVEKAILKSFENREAIDLISRETEGSNRYLKFNDEKSDLEFDEYYSDINNVIGINEENGRKYSKFSNPYVNAKVNLCFTDAPCGEYSEPSKASRVYNKEEYEIVINFFKENNNNFDLRKHKNQSLAEVKEKESDKYWCEVRGYCPNGDKSKSQN